jgi:hypothetical protein
VASALLVRINDSNANHAEYALDQLASSLLIANDQGTLSRRASAGFICAG